MSGSIIKRNNVYYAKYELPRGLDGKRRQKMVALPGVNSNAQAKKQLVSILNSIYNNTYAEPEKYTVGAYFQKWLQSTESSRAATTNEAYKCITKNYIIPHIGHYSIGKIRALQIREFYSKISPNVSTKTLRNIHGVVHAGFADAIDMNVIPFNPADNIKMPKYKLPSARLVQIESIPAILEAARGSQYYMAIVLCLMTGMRRGEVLALKWSDYNRSKKVLTIRHSMYQVTGERALKEPKSGRAHTIHVGNKLAAVLDEHRKAQLQASAAGAFTDNGWICTNGNGGHLTPAGISSAFRRIMNKCGVSCGLHGFRHAHATYLISLGVPVKVVSERLGHADVNITMNIYQDVLPNMQQDAARVFDGFIDGINILKNG